ncbi:GTP cyclohydrolase II [Nocardia sp. NPDC049149]|uniref:GTP cyclohydrolase II n=1 Tax=Nocardia sp. NPDC049149 TaxID=3364315 RepID=UPI00371DDB1A
MTTPLSHLADTDHRVVRKDNGLRIRVSELDDAGERGHLLIFGDLTPEDCLVRIHSRCLYGEVLGSDDCDCGPELEAALDLMQRAGSGVLVYLEQEGRGAGLVNKARGYRHSERHALDSFTSYQELGYPVDARTYDAAARGLFALGLRSIQLLTNNPAKVDAVRAAGLDVVVLPMITPVRSARALAYLEAKRVHRGHMIPIADASWPTAPVAAPVAWRTFLPLMNREFATVGAVAIMSILLVATGQVAAGVFVGLLLTLGYALWHRGLLVEWRARRPRAAQLPPAPLGLDVASVVAALPPRTAALPGLSSAVDDQGQAPMNVGPYSSRAPRSIAKEAV